MNISARQHKAALSVHADGAALCVSGEIHTENKKTYPHLKPGQKGTRRLVKRVVKG